MMLDRDRFLNDLTAGRRPRVTLTASDDLAVAVPVLVELADEVGLTIRLFASHDATGGTVLEAAPRSPKRIGPQSDAWLAQAHAGEHADR